MQGLLQLEGLTSCDHSKPAQILGATSWAHELQDPSVRAKVCVCDSEGCASFLGLPHSSRAAVPSQAFQVLIRIISSAECVTVCLSPAAKFPREQLFTMQCSHPETWAKMLRQTLMEPESSYSSLAVANLLGFFEF